MPHRRAAIEIAIDYFLTAAPDAYIMEMEKSFSGPYKGPLDFGLVFSIKFETLSPSAARQFRIIGV